MASQDKGQSPQRAGKRKAALSPELREMMHMLESLETELDPKQSPAG